MTCGSETVGWVTCGDTHRVYQKSQACNGTERMKRSRTSSVDQQHHLSLLGVFLEYSLDLGESVPQSVFLHIDMIMKVQHLFFFSLMFYCCFPNP